MRDLDDTQQPLHAVAHVELFQIGRRRHSRHRVGGGRCSVMRCSCLEPEIGCSLIGMLGPMHLLVLERDPERREALLAVLRSAGHHAVAAPDAPAVAAAIRQPGFDALLLDLGLPDLDLGRLREALVPADPVAPDSLEDAERRHIALMLLHTGGNKRQAAHLLGISRSTLLHKVRKYGLLTAVGLAMVAAMGATPTAQAQPEAACTRWTSRSWSTSTSSSRPHTECATPHRRGRHPPN